jgi:hypothetical protein
LNTAGTELPPRSRITTTTVRLRFGSATGAGYGDILLDWRLHVATKAAAINVSLLTFTADNARQRRSVDLSAVARSAKCKVQPAALPLLSGGLLREIRATGCGQIMPRVDCRNAVQYNLRCGRVA